MNEPINNKPKVYFENLDTLRFFAFMSVFISHVALFLGYQNGSFESWKGIFLVHGDIGVSFFFVLSGFLITFILFKEKEKNGAISFFNFYKKKALRIFPIYFLVVFIGFFVIYPIALKGGGYFPFSSIAPLSSLPWYIFFLENFKMAFYGVHSLVLAVLWAVSVEVQFYLVWPFVISFLSRKNILRFFFFVIIVSFIYRFFYYDNYNVVKYSTFSVMSDLAIGGLLAYITLFREKMKNLVEKMPKYPIILIYILGLSLIPLRSFLPDISGGIYYKIIYTLEPIIFSVFFAFVILEQNIANNSFFKFGRLKLFSYLGVRSFGMYCYHLVALFFVMFVFNKLGVTNPHDNLWLYILQIILVFIFTVIMSIISFKYFENKFLALKSK